MGAKSIWIILWLASVVIARHGESETGLNPPTSPSPSPVSTSSTTSQGTSTTQPPTSNTGVNPSPTSSSSSSSPSSTPSIPVQFNAVGNFTTCEPANFSWQSLSTSPLTLTITVTNGRIAARAIMPRQNQGNLVTDVVSSNVSSVANSVRWPAVDVPEGLYTVIAFETGNFNTGMSKSNMFSVTTGTNTSCLDPTTVQSSSSSAAPTGSSAGAAQSSSSSSGKDLSGGAVIGIVAGVLVGVGTLVLMFVVIPRLYRKGLLCKRRERRPGAPYLLF